MHTNYPRIYILLKKAGHTPFKAVEILLDASRGDGHALAWVWVLFAARGGYRA